MATTDHQAASIWLCIERIHAAGFSVAIEHKDGRAIVRARPTIIRVDRPVTVKYADGIVYERESARDAMGQLLTVIVGQMDLDAEERLAKLEADEKQAHAEVRGRHRLETKGASRHA